MPLVPQFVFHTVLYAGLVGLVFAPLEHAFPVRVGVRSAFRVDVLFATVGAVLVHLGLFVLSGILLALGDALPFDGPLSELPSYVAIPVGLVVFELAGYGYHRLAHASPTLFRLHAVHHSSTSMDWLAGFRQHPLEILLMTCAQNLPLVLLGLPLGAHALLVLLLRLNTTFVHANLRVPVGVGWLVATPAFHHRHHDVEAPAANYATLLPALDRLFGTYSAEVSERFGLPPAETLPASFLGMLVHPFRRLEKALPSDDALPCASHSSVVEPSDVCS